MASLTIRPASEAEVPEIHAMICELAEFEHLTHEVESTADDLRRALFGPRPIAEALVGFVDETIAGFALFFTTYSTFTGKAGLYLEDLYVRPAHRGCGLGKQLIVCGAELTIARGCARYEWVVLDWNARAIDFYRACGAEMQADWRRMRVHGAALRELASRQLL